MPMPHSIATSTEKSTERLGYQDQKTGLTLREGLVQYYEANPELIDPGETSTADLGDYMKNHDVSHVLFGTTTSLRDEVLQDMWTFLAIDVSKREYIVDFVKTDEGKQVMTSIPVWESLKSLVTLVKLLPLLLWRSHRMTKKWTWREWERYMDEPLEDTRREFGLEVL